MFEVNIIFYIWVLLGYKYLVSLFFCGEGISVGLFYFFLFFLFKGLFWIFLLVVYPQLIIFYNNDVIVVIFSWNRILESAF